MNALPENQRKNSLLPLLNAYARPAAPLAGSHLPAEKFRAAVQSAGIGNSNDVPHLTESLIDKYVSDLQAAGPTGVTRRSPRGLTSAPPLAPSDRPVRATTWRGSRTQSPRPRTPG